MNKVPSVLTKRQARKYAVIAFSNFINSGNTTNFDISIMETFYEGAMEAHDKSSIVDYTNNLEDNHKELMKMNIEKNDM